jgi:hypothetical protein
MTESPLLFPSATGGFRSASCLDEPFDEVVTALKLKKRSTPRAMRRTFQDLARAAEVKDVVTRTVSGHATEAMPQHYSTVSPIEMNASLAKVIDPDRHPPGDGCVRWWEKWWDSAINS